MGRSETWDKRIIWIGGIDEASGMGNLHGENRPGIGFIQQATISSIIVCSNFSNPHITPVSYSIPSGESYYNMRVLRRGFSPLAVWK